MAKNIKEVRETIGINDEPIRVTAYEPKITIIDLGKYEFSKSANQTQREVKSNEIADGMSIAVVAGGRQDKDEMYK